jgi:PAS domain S-box-containing protein
MVASTPKLQGYRWPPLTRYLLAVVTTAVCVLFRWALDPILGDAVPYISIFPAIIFCTWYFGTGPSILSSILGLIAAHYLFFAPRYSLAVYGPGELVQISVFLVVAAFMVMIGDRNRRTVANLDATNATLEARVQERTVELQRQAAQLAGRSQLLDMANDAVFATEEEKIAYWNRGAERLYGWTSNDAIGKDPGDLLQTQLPIPREQITEQVVQEGYWEGDVIQTRRDGARMVVASRWSRWRDGQGKDVGYLEINTDISERKRAEESLRELTGRLLRLQDDERRRIARELHDSTGQMLVALAMNLASLQMEAGELPDKAARTLSDSHQLVQEITKELRTLSYLLHPPLLDEAGLASALRWYVEGFSKRSHVMVNVEFDPSVGRMPRETETAIFRIVQECLTNVHRHSGSSFAGIRVERHPGGIRIEVVDEGKGIPADKLDNPKSSGGLGIGITGMRERVRQLGGKLEIISDEAGTLVRAELPISEAPEKASSAGLLNSLPPLS